MTLPPCLAPLGLPRVLLDNILRRRADHHVGRWISLAPLRGPVLRWTPGQGHRAPSAGSGNLFGNNEMSIERVRQAQQVLLGTVESGANARAEFRGGEQPGGFDHAALAGRPLGLDRIEPGTLAGQVAIDNPHALAVGFDLLIVRADPVPDQPTAVPGRVVPHQQQGFLPGRRQARAAPREKLRGPRAHGAAGHKPQPGRLGPVAVRRGPANQQAVAGQRFRIRVGFRDRLFLQPQRLVRRGPTMQGRLGQPAPPPLVLEPQRPARVGGHQMHQAIAGTVFRAYSGSGLVIQRLARCQRMPKRSRVARMVSPLIRAAVSPRSKLTSAANSKVQRLVGFPKVRGLWCNRARSCSPRAASKATRNRWGRDEPLRSAARPRVLNAASALRTVWASQPRWPAIWGAGSPRALASRIWHRRWTKASDERKPATNWARSASVTGRTYTGCFILLSITRNRRPCLRLH